MEEMMEMEDCVAEASAPKYEQRTPFNPANQNSRRFVNRSVASFASVDHQDAPSLTTPYFKFINTAEDQHSVKGYRSAVRSHVMHNFYRQKDGTPNTSPDLERSAPQYSTAAVRLENEHAASPWTFPIERGLSPDNITSQDGAMHHLIRVDENYRSQINSSARWLSKLAKQGPSLTTVNPWVFPISPRACELIHYYIQNIAKSSIPMTFASESALFLYAINDPACYHGTLYLSMIHKALLVGAGHPWPIEMYQHKGEAIRIINERLDAPKCQIEDGTIAAIACLAASENVGGSAAVGAVHVTFLEKMVELRGGIHRLGMDGFLELFLSWVDLCNASLVVERPKFAPHDHLGPEPSLSDEEALSRFLNDQWDATFVGQLPLKAFDGMDALGTSIFHRLRQMSLLLSVDQFIATGPNQQKYTRSVLLLERQINASAHGMVLNNIRHRGLPSLAPTCRTFHISGLIYLYMVLRKIPIRSSVFDSFTRRLKTAIDLLEPRQLWGHFPLEYLLWTLVIGGTASLGRPERPFFLGLASKLSKYLQLKSWEQSKAILLDFAWVESICEEPCKAFWNELE
ncbi:hypothetical protein N431DRAFT_481151 [Stipitochalara longipes BDJ]|nr:hypothetical protein N431DRAFT_481151 [Stipitochalara longipes BDJ]